MKSINLALVVVMLALAPACSGDDQSTTDGGNDSGNANDSGNTNDSGNANDSGDTSDSGNDSGNGDSGATLEAYFGHVTFTQSETTIANVTTDTYTASAGFYETPDGGVASGCSGTQSGSCCYVPSGGATPSFTAVSAGGITLKDGSTTIGTMSPNGTTYPSLNSGTTNTLKWKAGDTLNVSAAGDTVHAFSGNVAAVAILAGTSPPIGGLTPVSVSKGTDFTLTWTAGTGAITLALSQQNHGVITCTSSTDSGTMTVPHALVGNFNTGNATISLTREISADASNDNATLTLGSSTSQAGNANITQ